MVLTWLICEGRISDSSQCIGCMEYQPAFIPHLFAFVKCICRSNITEKQ